MKITKRILISLCITPVVYLGIAFVLIFLPVKRNIPGESLDFSVLQRPSISQHMIEELHYIARDGAKLFYRLFPGNAELVVVIIHGSGSEGRYLAGLAEDLSSKLGADVVLPDLRGHGRSAEPFGDIDYLGQYEHDLHDLNTHLRKLNPGAKIFLGGHSSGGGLAVKYAGNTELEEFDGYILLAPYLGYQAPTVRPDSGGWVQVAIKRYIGLSMVNNIGIRQFNSV